MQRLISVHGLGAAQTSVLIDGMIVNGCRTTARFRAI
jgi:hypothetical protein